MKHSFVLPTVFILGMALVILGMSWNFFVPTSAYWSVEKAAEFTEAQTDLHAQSHPEGADQEQKFLAARERFIKIRDELEDARSNRSSMKFVVTALGIGFLTFGVIFHLSTR